MYNHPIGAKIATPGEGNTTHEGIFGGFDSRGIPFVIENSKLWGEVVISSLHEFSSSGDWWIVELAPSGLEDEMVRRALALLGKRYDVGAYNCQHFTSEVFTGEAASWELQQIAGGLVIGAIAIAAFRSAPARN